MQSCHIMFLIRWRSLIPDYGPSGQGAEVKQRPVRHDSAMLVASRKASAVARTPAEDHFTQGSGWIGSLFSILPLVGISAGQLKQPHAAGLCGFM